MIITDITPQQKIPNRVNVFVDGAYRLSLDIFQLVDLGVKKGNSYTEQELIDLETESSFGKVYARALEYCLMRPHSAKEVRDYLWRKTQNVRAKDGGVRKGVSATVTERVFARLVEKRYIDDEKFARYWIENRNLNKGSSLRKLSNELRMKGVANAIIDRLLSESSRNDQEELLKIVAKKQSRYPDRQKFIQYLMRQGFSYDSIQGALEPNDIYL